jgi:hypothetical protein
MHKRRYNISNIADFLLFGRGDGHLATLEEALFSGSLESGLFLGNLISYSPFLYACWLSGFILLFLQIR